MRWGKDWELAKWTAQETMQSRSFHHLSTFPTFHEIIDGSILLSALPQSSQIPRWITHTQIISNTRKNGPNMSRKRKVKKRRIIIQSTPFWWGSRFGRTIYWISQNQEPETRIRKQQNASIYLDQKKSQSINNQSRNSTYLSTHVSLSFLFFAFFQVFFGKSIR